MKIIFYLIGAILIIFLLILFGINFENISEYFFGGLNATNPRGEVLKITIQISGGIILLFGAFYSLRIADSMNENNKLMEKGNIAERFKNAINMLDDNNSSTCLGGIYALDNIAKDNSEYREQVFNILVEFINYKTKNLPSWKDIPKPDRFNTSPTIEIQTIVKLLFSKHNSIYKTFNANIENAKLYGAKFKDYNFSRCTFENVEFQNSFLNKTWFAECKIHNTDFTFSDLANTIFTGAKIRSSIFSCCGLFNTNFIGCRISQTDFICSKFTVVDFDGAIANFCSFNGAFMDESSFNAASFSSISVKGLHCIGDGIIARGARFEAGISATEFRTNIKALIGEKAIIKTKIPQEIFPEEELKKLENLLDINSIIKFDCHNLLLIKNNRHLMSEGWVFSDTGILTNNDYKSIINQYDDMIKKVS